MRKIQPRSVLKQSCFQLLDILFPRCCIQCHAGGSSFCARCRTTLPYFAPPVCPGCGDPQAEGHICRHCRYEPLTLSGLRAFSDYTEPLRSIIHAFKYRGNTLLGESLGTLLTETYLRHQMAADLIVPVPLHAERFRQRGYNQAQLLAACCARQLHLPLATDLLMRTRTTATQVTLKAQDRRINLRGAFHYQEKITTQLLLNRKILVIDDVCTTGATLEACANLLFAAGAKEVWGLVLAHPSVTRRTTLT
jgi:ComF family protein